MENYSLHINKLFHDQDVSVLKKEFGKNKINACDVKSGKIILNGKPNFRQLRKIIIILKNNGLELEDVRKKKICIKIKRLLINLFNDEHNKTLLQSNKYSKYISENIGLHYNYLSSIFSLTQHITIKDYMKRLKIKYVKKLLLKGKLNLSQIADKFGYCDVHHLSNQFKKITGITPTQFRKYFCNMPPPPHAHT